MNNKGYLVAIVVIVLVIAGYVFYMSVNTGSNSTTEQTPSTNTTTGTTQTGGTGGSSSQNTQAPAATVGGGIPNQPGSSTKPPAGDAYNPALQVSYTDQGFQPKSLVIKKGQAVEFMNQSSGYMWVASDPHPSHTGYPGFDEKMVGQRGDTYEFTFTKVGTWGYHNHLTPAMKGTIIVQ